MKWFILMALAMSFGSQAQAQGLNHEVLRLHGEMQGATAPTALELRREAAAAIVLRASEMSSLIEKDPAQALSKALSADLAADLAAKFHVQFGIRRQQLKNALFGH